MPQKSSAFLPRDSSVSGDVDDLIWLQLIVLDQRSIYVWLKWYLAFSPLALMVTLH